MPQNPDKETGFREGQASLENEEIIAKLGFSGETPNKLILLLDRISLIRSFLDGHSGELDPENAFIGGKNANLLSSATKIQDSLAEIFSSVRNPDPGDPVSFIESKKKFEEKFIDVADGVVSDLLVYKSTPSNAPEVSKSKEKDIEIVRAIYDRLRTNHVPASQEYRLPEFDSLFEKNSPKEAYDLMTTAIMKRILDFYGDNTASGSTSFAFQGGSVDAWSSDEMFNITLEGSEDNTTFKFFIENFPWERFLKNESRTELNIIDLKKEIVDSWKFRILAIQNAGNAASGIENLWRGQEHGNYHDTIYDHISARGDGGGNQGWDLAPYYNRTHLGDENGKVLLREILGGKEDGWMLPEYENYFLYQIERKYNKLHLNDKDKLSKLKEDLTNGDKSGTILYKLREQIKLKFGKDRLKKDLEKIDLAALKAAWTIIHTLKIHEWDKGGIQSRLGRYNIKPYFGKVFSEGVSGVQWRPQLAASVERAIIPFETVTTLDLILVSDGKPIYDKHSFDYKKKDFKPHEKDSEDYIKYSEYRRWLLDLKLKSLDNYTNISKVEDIDWLKSEKKRLEKIAPKNKNDLVSQTERASELKQEITNWDNYKVDGSYQEHGHIKKSSQKLKDQDINSLSEIQKSIDAYKDLEYLKKLLDHLSSSLKKALPAEDKDLLVERAATTFAIESRYLVIKIKKDNTGLGFEDELSRLPIAIPVQKLRTLEDKKDGLVIGTKEVPVQMVRDSQIDTSKFVDWNAISKNPNSSWVGFSLELKRWFKMLDLQDHDAIFPSVHEHRLQEKIIPEPLVFEEAYALKFLGIQARITRLLINRTDKSVFKLGQDVDILLRKRVLITDIPLSELISETDDENEKPPGFGFTKITQYAAKYLFGKTPNKLLLLEMFRDKPHDLAEIIKIESSNPGSDAKANFARKITTAVPGWLRSAIDESLDKPKSKRPENEVILGLFWLAIDGYLDQYSFNEHVGQSLGIPATKKGRDGLMNAVETVSGDKPMNFADRELFIAYVSGMLKYFDSSSFAIGDEVPRNIGSAADVVKMMERKGIIGSPQQVLTDLDYLEGDFAGLVKREAAKNSGGH